MNAVENILSVAGKSSDLSNQLNVLLNRNFHLKDTQRLHQMGFCLYIKSVSNLVVWTHSVGRSRYSVYTCETADMDVYSYLRSKETGISLLRK